jgi:hypothetical protein
MKNHTKFEEWHHIIASREGTFVSQIMEKAVQYLRNARNEEGGWGYYKGLPTDIHASSLAIEALRINKGRELETSAEDAAVHIKTIISCNLDTLGIQQIVDLLNILSGTKPRDSELESKVVARLKDLRHDEGWGEPEPSITLSCGVILAFMKLENPPQDLIKQWVDYLAQCQRSDDGGGWGATPDSKSAIIPTSRALRVLNCFSDKSLAETRAASIEFFRNYFQTKDWTELGDTFTISTVLRVLSEIEEFSFEIVQAGIDSLYERVNSDGGWGPVKGEPSNIEHTALSMIALSSVGENKFVPSRLVNATLETAEAKIMQLRNERDRLLEDVDQRVQKEIKNIIYERNELQKKVDHYKEEVSHLEANVREMKFELRDVKAKREFMAQKIKYEPGVRWGFNINRKVIMAAFLSVIFSIGTYFFLIGNTTLFLTTVVVSVSGLSTYFFMLWRNQLRFRRYRLELRPERHFIVSKLINLLEEWPPSKREDFLFQLTRLMMEGREVSLDKLEDTYRYLFKRYVERESQYRQLQEIIYELMKLPPSARLAVIDELRGIFS